MPSRGCFKDSRLPRRAVLALTLSAVGCSVDARTLQVTVTDPLFVPGEGEDGGALGGGGRDGGGGSSSGGGGDLTYGSGGAAGAKADAGDGPPEECLHFVDGSPDCDKTLTRNSDFNTVVSDWDASGLVTLRWVPFDSQNAKGSGALAVKVTEHQNLDGLVGAAATQCLAIAQETTYDFDAWTYIQGDQVDFGTAQIVVWFYDKPNCQGLVHTPAYSLGEVQATNSWLSIVRSIAPLPEIHSMSVRLVAQKPYRSGDFEVLFDAVRVTSHQ